MEPVNPIAAAKAFLQYQKELGVMEVPLPSTGVSARESDPSQEAGSVATAPAHAHEVVDDAPVQETGPSVSDDLDAFAKDVATCEACALSEGRKHVVFGSGSRDADIMFIGEAPGREEDMQGLPFVGAAGELLTKMIEGMQLSREDVYIANIIKCRPPGNRDPLPEEIAQCEPYLLRQIEMIKPTVICTLGRFAAQTLLRSTTSMGRLRGKVYDYNGIKLIPTYHPAALLRNPQWKRPTWEDLKRLRFEYDGTQL